MDFLPGRSYFLRASNWDASFIPPGVLPIDQLIVSAADLTAKDLRSLLIQAAEKPFGQARLLVITNAGQLSDILQNTLLKTLEEPAAQLIIIVQGDNPETLLPTVRSRLQLVISQNETQAASAQFPGSKTALVKFLQAAKDRSALALLLTNELNALKITPPTDPIEQAQHLSLLEKSLLRLQQNCNQKLVIDALVLHWFAE